MELTGLTEMKSVKRDQRNYVSGLTFHGITLLEPQKTK